MKQLKVIIRPYTTKELVELYGVSIPTFIKWIKKFEDELGEKQGWFWNIKQVRLIFEKLGKPGMEE